MKTSLPRKIFRPEAKLCRKLGKLPTTIYEKTENNNNTHWKLRWISRRRIIVNRIKKKGNYLEDMGGSCFEIYFKNILKKLSYDSVMMMNNAFYHIRLAECLPTTKWMKVNLSDWLKSKNIDSAELWYNFLIGWSVKILILQNFARLKVCSITTMPCQIKHI